MIYDPKSLLNYKSQYIFSEYKYVFWSVLKGYKYLTILMILFDKNPLFSF